MAGAEGRCPQCQKLFDSRRMSPHKRGYDADHEKLRIQCFERDRWRCVDCGWEPDIVREFREGHISEPPPTEVVLIELRERWHRGDRHLHGDHNVAVQARPDLRLHLDNYRTLCNKCHTAKTMHEQQVSGMPAESEQHRGDGTSKGTPTIRVR
jgi:hypothetical protein